MKSLNIKACHKDYEYIFNKYNLTEQDNPNSFKPEIGETIVFRGIKFKIENKDTWDSIYELSMQDNFYLLDELEKQRKNELQSGASYYRDSFQGNLGETKFFITGRKKYA